MGDSPPTLAELMKNTLLRVESDLELTPEDPKLVELRRAMARHLAEIQLLRSQDSRPVPSRRVSESPTPDL